MTSPNAQFDLATFLAAAGLSLTVGTNVFATAEMPQSDVIPAKAVFCQAYGGREMDVYVGQAPHGVVYPKVQVCVRGDPHDLGTAQALARSVWDALCYATITGYLRCKCLQSGPVYLGLNDLQQPRFAINVEMMAAV